MIEWFKNLTDANKIAIVVPVALAAIGGLFALFKWLSKKKGDSSTQQTTINIFNVNVYDEVKILDEIKEMFAKRRDQENENG